MGSTNMGSPQLLNLGKYLHDNMQPPQNNQTNDFLNQVMVSDFGAVSPNQGGNPAVWNNNTPTTPMVGGNMANDFVVTSPNQNLNFGGTLGGSKQYPSEWRPGVWNNEPTRPMFGDRYRGYNG